MVMRERTELLGRDLAVPCPSPGVPEPGAAVRPSLGDQSTHRAHIGPSEAVVSPICFPDLSDGGEVICSPHDPMDPLLPATSSALSPGTAREADPPSAGAPGDAELQDALGQGNKPTGVRQGPCVCPALPQRGFSLVSLALGRRLKRLH